KIESHARGRDPFRSLLVVPREQPGRDENAERARFEAQWHDGTQLTVTVVVQGWLRKNGDLWRVGNLYWVYAPNHLLFNWGLKAKTVTFEQNESAGTTTTLELVLPWFLNGLLFQEGLPGPPGPAKPSGQDQPAQTPAQTPQQPPAARPSASNGGA